MHYITSSVGDNMLVAVHVHILATIIYLSCHVYLLHCKLYIFIEAYMSVCNMKHVDDNLLVVSSSCSRT